MNAKKVFVLIMFYSSNLFSQLSEDWIMETLRTYSPTSYGIINQYKINGNSISYNHRSSTFGMTHLEFCDRSSIKQFLSSISTTVHETTHGYDSQIPYMLAKQGSFIWNDGNSEGFYFDDLYKVAFKFPKNKLFPSAELIRTIPIELRTFRFPTYITSSSRNQSTQSEGIIGLMEEFNAYYHGSKVIFDLLPVFKEEYGNNFLWSWSSQFTSNSESFYEFDFFIKEYLLYAKSNYPELYQELKNDNEFKLIYKNIRSRFSSLIDQYEKKYDEFTTSTKKNNGEVIYSSNKHSSTIHPILAEQIKSPRYSEINSIFLTK